jgi:hypothetical protein
MSRKNIPSLITDWNQARFAKKATRCFQEEVNEETAPIRGSYLGILKGVNSFPKPASRNETGQMQIWFHYLNFLRFKGIWFLVRIENKITIPLSEFIFLSF